MGNWDILNNGFRFSAYSNRDNARIIGSQLAGPDSEIVAHASNPEPIAVDHCLIAQFVADRLRRRSAYVVPLIVGTLINLYGHLLVPWFRGVAAPLDAVRIEAAERPGVLVLSVVIAYVFPFLVSLYAGVSERYRNRRSESIADFPECNPDPVFRVSGSGQIVEAGARTKLFLDEASVDTAAELIGEQAWQVVSSSPATSETLFVELPDDGQRYLVRWQATANDMINIYLTRLAGIQV